MYMAREERGGRPELVPFTAHELHLTDFLIWLPHVRESPSALRGNLIDQYTTYLLLNDHVAEPFQLIPLDSTSLSYLRLCRRVELTSW